MSAAGPVTTAPRLAVVVVGYESGGDLRRSLPPVLAQLGSGDELIVVDNASTDDTAAVSAALSPVVRVIRAGRNLGFAGGVNLGASAATADLLLLLNPDAVVQPGSIDALRAAAVAHPRWGAWQALVTLPGGERVNTAGNVVHYLGFGWAGRWEEPVAAVAPDAAEVGFGSGAALVVRRDAWTALGGFEPRYFMYGEDLDLCLRLRLAGWGVGLVPAARVEHEYDFEKGDYKWFHLERNRWWTLVGVYPGPLLLALLPALLAFELALLPAAAQGGWLRAKLRAQAATLRELPAMLRRRRRIQATRRCATGAFAAMLDAGLDSPVLAGARAIPGAEAALRAYWRLARTVAR